MNNPKSILNVSGECFDYVRVFSDGILGTDKETILQHSLVRFHLLIVLFVCLSRFFHFLLGRFCLPRITSEILTGMILAPTARGYVFHNSKNPLFPPFPEQVFAALSKISFLVFTFLASVRTNPLLVKQMGTKAMIFGFLLFVVPATMESFSIIVFPIDERLTFTVKTHRRFLAVYYISMMTSSQFAGVSTTLMQLKIANSRLGHFALASTLVNDLLRFTYSTMDGFYRAMLSTSITVAIKVVLYSLALVGVIFSVMRATVHWFIRRTPEDKPMKEVYVTVTVAMVLGLASIGDSVGMYFLFGPFLLGLVVPAGSPLATALITKLDTLSSGFLVPLMLVYSSSKFDLQDFIRYFPYAVNFQAALIGYTIKLIITFIGAISCRLPLSEAAALTLLVNVKGVVEVGSLLSFGNLEMYDLGTTSGIFFVFLTSGILPPLINLLYDPAKQYIGHTKKCIEHAPNDAELGILACSHRQEDVMTAIKLLKYCNPTKQSHLSIYGLYLEELISSSTPLLINHQLGQKNSYSDESRTQRIIDIYKYFKSQNKKLNQVHVFTAISPLKQMYEDICGLAFDKAVSLIILPFHKKWSNKGKLVSSSSEMRSLNNIVLDRAPCSVGILIDRLRSHGINSIFGMSKMYRVVVLFIGGPDDRESLAFALRMAGDPCVQLTVLHFVSDNSRLIDEWEEMLDYEALRNIKLEVSRSANIVYKRKEVKDGSDTAAIVQSVANHYQLIIVGRRHESCKDSLSGLSDWTELPELGPIGDFLAATDFNDEVSILVIQRQILKASHSSALN
ncbi:hypothetical protein K2173_004944 [Erythroxylum novogranatense]|uniref:Cation/H+ exchanger domain-containing protein n=1 Tax=Erythroxylum novogranatense TaxID=1862640 RepID=A0AAV8TBM2_9ROSI|nr:hypothetical protein K2173_004944 [Erythroxylum novogranatense]